MVSASEIALALKLPTPTEEQIAIAEAPVGASSRVIAGAGSGKTETMALRVLWLVANGFLEPELILGLTFTRKAKAELGSRIRLRLGELTRVGMLKNQNDFRFCSIATYNSFAGKIYRDFAPLLGRDPDARVLSEASAWALAARVVSRSRLPNLEELDLSLGSLVGMVRNLGFRMKENNVDTGHIEQFVAEFVSSKDLPNGGRGSYKKVEEWADRVAALIPLARLVGELDEEKSRAGVVEFSDQVFLATQLAEQSPWVVEQTRLNHRVVLLDEYQDTSVLQARLLSILFSNHSVMAVGDPTQAIYGWRGASGSNFVDFEANFGNPVETFSLSTSWRNGAKILKAANLIASGLPLEQTPIVRELKPSHGASSGNLEWVFSESIEEESEKVAGWLDKRLRESENQASAAILLRSRSNQKFFVDALAKREIPTSVLGIGGLLEEPVVVDIVCTLKVLATGAADSEFIRLLAGARWRLGVSDLKALRQTAIWLRGRDYLGRPLPESGKSRPGVSNRFAEKPSLLDAVSFLVEGTRFRKRWSEYSEAARARIIEIYQIFNELSNLPFSTIESLVARIQKIMNLDIETQANPARMNSEAALEAFFGALNAYQGATQHSSIVGFVSWLEDAERSDNFRPRSEPPENGCVQILTIHGAKGLEWDLVAVPRLVTDELPARSRNSFGWLRGGELPYQLRGDRSTLPNFGWKEAKSRKDLVDRQSIFADEIRSHDEHEERRLMYVAMTRARHHVFVSGSFWGSNSSPRAPSIFLQELAESGLIGELPVQPEGDKPVKNDESVRKFWPGDPLGSRRQIIEKSADAVFQALRKKKSSSADTLASQLLGTENAATGKMFATELQIPVRIPASQLAGWFTEPHLQAARIRRPMPEKRSTSATRGSAFHRYVENYFYRASLGPLPGLDPEYEAGFEEIRDLISSFEASEFAIMKPVAVEQELDLPIAGHILVCKIDAVFQDAETIHIVDWKTGEAPKGLSEVASKSIQLAAYRAAWSRWKDVNEKLVKASFWFAGSGTLFTPSELPGATELERRLREISMA